MHYRLYESAGFLGSHPAFADSDDFDALRLWAVKYNDWKGVRTAAVIVSDAGRVWYVSRSGKAREASHVRAPSDSASQVEKLINRLEDRYTPESAIRLVYEVPGPERRAHRIIHVSAK